MAIGCCCCCVCVCFRMALRCERDDAGHASTADQGGGDSGERGAAGERRPCAAHDATSVDGQRSLCVRTRDRGNTNTHAHVVAEDELSLREHRVLSRAAQKTSAHAISIARHKAQRASRGCAYGSSLFAVSLIHPSVRRQCSRQWESSSATPGNSGRRALALSAATCTEFVVVPVCDHLATRWRRAITDAARVQGERSLRHFALIHCCACRQQIDPARMSEAPAAAIGVHSATAGYAHDANALYDASRPAYSDDVVDYLLHAAVGDALTALAPSAVPLTPRVIRLVDLGCGTGIFTRCLAARVRAFEAANSAALQARGLSFEVLGVEPVAGMRQRFQEHCPGLSVMEGSGSFMPSLASQSVDAVFAAQAFHWFATAEALQEIARVLKPQGKFLPVWNSRDTSIDWIGVLDSTIVDPLYPPDVPRQQTRRWKQVFTLPPRQFELRAKKEWREGMVQRGGEEMVIGRVLSVSVAASLPKQDQDAIAERIRQLLRTHPQTKDSKEFELKYFTDAYVYCKIAAADSTSSCKTEGAAAAASSISASTGAASGDGEQSFTAAINAGGWLNEPAEWSVSSCGSSLSLRTALASDFWQRTHYAFQRDSGHFLAFATPSGPAGFTAEVRVRARFSSLYDQAGLMVRLDSDRWCKAGIELSDGVCMASTVVTTGGFSDWSTAPFAGNWKQDAEAAAAAASSSPPFAASSAPASASAAASASASSHAAASAAPLIDFRVRMTVAGGSLRVQLSHDDGRTWPLIRLAPFPVADSYTVGPMSCTPEREGLCVEFSEMRITKANGKDLHDLS